MDDRGDGGTRTGNAARPALRVPAGCVIAPRHPAIRRLFLGENFLARKAFRTWKYLVGQDRISLRAIFVL
jgi:hypothetical protein